MANPSSNPQGSGNLGSTGAAGQQHAQGGTSLTGLAQDAASAISDKASSLAGSVSDISQQVASSTTEAARSAAQTIGRGLETGTDYVSDQTRQGFRNLTRLAQENPGPALLIGFAIGLALGLLLVPRR